MARVFISHSKEDEKGRGLFDKLFGSGPHQGYWYSWEGPTPPHAKTLIEAIKASASMFVILSEPMEELFTRSWVGYEVGAAAALNKNIWVFEPIGAFINVPVPSVTGYFKYSYRITEKKRFPLLKIIDTAGEEVPLNVPGLTGRLLSVFCPYLDCKAPYFKYFSDTISYCPVCRRKILPMKNANSEPLNQ